LGLWVRQPVLPGKHTVAARHERLRNFPQDKRREGSKISPPRSGPAVTARNPECTYGTAISPTPAFEIPWSPNAQGPLLRKAAERKTTARAVQSKAATRRTGANRHTAQQRCSCSGRHRLRLATSWAQRTRSDVRLWSGRRSRRRPLVLARGAPARVARSTRRRLTVHRNSKSNST
jgi:hypothetical protein